MRLLLFLCFLIAASSNLGAQEKAGAVGALSVLSVPPGAEVYVDSDFVGIAPKEVAGLKTGLHIVRAFYPSVTSWNCFSRIDTVNIQPGSNVNLMWEFGSIINLNTVPSGASVLYNREPLGVTPFMWKSRESLQGIFTLEKAGYQRHEVFSPGRGYFSSLIWLTKNPDVRPPGDILDAQVDGETAQPWMTYLAGSAMIVSGFLAAYFKDQANRNFNEYQKTQDQSTLDTKDRLDRLSGVSFVLTQISFGILAYKLLLE